MYLYNTTFVISTREYGWWVNWMTRIYLPTLADMAPHATNELYKLDIAQPDTLSFSCQWRCANVADLGTIDKYSKALNSKLTEEKGEACLYFSTMMKSVEL